MTSGQFAVLLESASFCVRTVGGLSFSFFLRPAEAGEGRVVVEVDSARGLTAATTATRTVATTTSELAASTTTTTAAPVTTVSASTVSAAFSTTVSTASTAAATAPAALGLLPGLVDVEDVLDLALALAAGLGTLALDILGLLFLLDLLGGRPLLVVFGALVRLARFLETQVFQLLGSLLGQVLRVGLALVFRLGLLRFSGVLLVSGEVGVRDEGSFTFGVDGGGRCSAPAFLLLFLLGDGLAGALVGKFGVSSGSSPAVGGLLVVLTNTLLVWVR